MARVAKDGKRTAAVKMILNGNNSDMTLLLSSNLTTLKAASRSNPWRHYAVHASIMYIHTYVQWQVIEIVSGPPPPHEIQRLCLDPWIDHAPSLLS